MKGLLVELVEQHWEQLQGVDYCEVFANMRIRHDQNQVGCFRAFGWVIHVQLVCIKGDAMMPLWMRKIVITVAPSPHTQDRLAPGKERDGEGSASAAAVAAHRAAQEAELLARQRAAAAAEQRRRRECAALCCG